MTERPILMNETSLLAILDGRKSQTRRAITPQPEPEWAYCFMGRTIIDDTLLIPTSAYGHRDTWRCPYGQPGDRLWIREAWELYIGAMGYLGPKYRIRYMATPDAGYTWLRCDRELDVLTSTGSKPSIFMPREFSRISLEIEKVRAAPVQDITPDDAIAEGYPTSMKNLGEYPVDWFMSLWNSINADRGYPWADNPWVWAITFRVIREEEA